MHLFVSACCRCLMLSSWLFFLFMTAQGVSEAMLCDGFNTCSNFYAITFYRSDSHKPLASNVLFLFVIPSQIFGQDGSPIILLLPLRFYWSGGLCLQLASPQLFFYWRISGWIESLSSLRWTVRCSVIANTWLNFSFKEGYDVSLLCTVRRLITMCS